MQFGLLFDLIEDAQVNLVNDEVRPEPPIDIWPHVVLIPGRADDLSAEFAVFLDRQKLKLSMLDVQIPVQMRGLNLSCPGGFSHSGRLRDNVET